MPKKKRVRMRIANGTLTFPDRTGELVGVDSLGSCPATPREELLAEASRLITGDRNRTYGSPTQNFQDTAEIWTALLRHKLAPGEALQPGEVAMLMVALKLARMKAQPKRDNWTDVAGYAGCGYEADLESGRIAGEVTTSATEEEGAG